MGIDLSYPSAIAASSKELISTIVAMYVDLSYKAGSYIEEVTRKVIETKNE